jgi:phosphatidylinositol 4-phosphatase
LVSRKDCRRPGRRFITRGLDQEGFAANFAETEHIFVHHEKDSITVASYVQIRGSIPLIWSMKPNLKWSPPVKINNNFLASKMAAEVHFKGTK